MLRLRGWIHELVFRLSGGWRRPRFGQVRIDRRGGELGTVHIECECPDNEADIEGIRASRVFVPVCPVCGTRRGWFVSA